MKRKFVSLLTGALMLTLVPMQTLAADVSNTTITVTEAGTQTATVTYSQDSTFTVTIPKEITIPSAKTATYNVNVKGDIKRSEKITVTPDATVSMTDANGKAAVDVTIEQTVKEFAADAVNTAEGSSTTGSVDGSKLTAGSWSGTLNFDIEKVAAGSTETMGADVTLTAAKLADYGISTTGAVTIPSVVTDSTDGSKHKVTAIGDNAFQNASLDSVTLPESVTKIGDNAFAGCDSLTTVDLKNVTSIGNYAFTQCTSLASVTIPTSVTSIGTNVFNNALISATFETTDGWFTGDTVGTKTNAVTASDLQDATVAARLLTNDNAAKYWTR